MQPARAMPFCAATSAITCISRCRRMAASRIASSMMASGTPRSPCDWQTTASTAPRAIPVRAPPTGEELAGVSGAARALSIEAGWRQTSHMAITAAIPGTAINGRCSTMAGMATAPD